MYRLKLKHCSLLRYRRRQGEEGMGGSVTRSLSFQEAICGSYGSAWPSEHPCWRWFWERPTPKSTFPRSRTAQWRLSCMSTAGRLLFTSSIYLLAGSSALASIHILWEWSSNSISSRHIRLSSEHYTPVSGRPRSSPISSFSPRPSQLSFNQRLCTPSSTAQLQPWDSVIPPTANISSSQHAPCSSDLSPSR